MITILSKRRIKHVKYSIYTYLCSDRVERTLSELALLAKVTQNTITVRISKKGLTHPKILSGYVRDGHSLESGVLCKGEKNGNAAWQALDNLKTNRIKNETSELF